MASRRGAIAQCRRRADAAYFRSPPASRPSRSCVGRPFAQAVNNPFFSMNATTSATPSSAFRFVIT